MAPRLKTVCILFFYSPSSIPFWGWTPCLSPQKPAVKMNRKRPGNFWTKFGNSEHSVTGEPLHTYTHTERRTVARTLAFIFISFSFSLTTIPTSAELYRNKVVRSGEYLLLIANYSALRRPVPSTDQALPSCLYFRISWILMEWPWKHLFGSCGFLQGLRS